MSDSMRLAEELETRLPELLWQMNQLTHAISSKSLPKGLFRGIKELTPEEYIKDLKQDLVTLKTHKNPISAHYLAERIGQKIDVLVFLCRKKNMPEKNSARRFGLDAISTRQQWLQSQEKEIAALKEQKQALMARMNKHVQTESTEEILRLQAEIGRLDKELTLLTEAKQKAFMI